jgi:hypothetical protein
MFAMRVSTFTGHEQTDENQEGQQTATPFKSFV